MCMSVGWAQQAKPEGRERLDHGFYTRLESQDQSVEIGQGLKGDKQSHNMIINES